MFSRICKCFWSCPWDRGRSVFAVNWSRSCFFIGRKRKYFNRILFWSHFQNDYWSRNCAHFKGRLQGKKIIFFNCSQIKMLDNFPQNFLQFFTKFSTKIFHKIFHNFLQKFPHFFPKNIFCTKIVFFRIFNIFSNFLFSKENIKKKISTKKSIVFKFSI